MRPVLRCDVAGQRVGVGRAQLRQLAPLEHRVDEAARVLGQLLVGGEIVEQTGARLPLPGLGALAAGKLQAVEQQFAELARRAEVELVADEAIHLLLQPRDPLRKRAGQPRQDCGVDLDAGALHVGDDRKQRPLQRLVDGDEAFRRRAAASAASTAAASRRRPRPRTRSPCRAGAARTCARPSCRVRAPSPDRTRCRHDRGGAWRGRPCRGCPCRRRARTTSAWCRRRRRCGCRAGPAH